MEKGNFQVAEVSITYSSKLKLSECPSISSSRDAENVLRARWSSDIEFVEEFAILILNRANKVMGISRISRGGQSGTVVDTKVVMATAIKAMAAGIILCHNHPSGNLQPSQADRDLTKKLQQAGTILDISVLDHIILAPEHGYFSFADEGYL